MRYSSITLTLTALAVAPAWGAEPIDADITLRLEIAPYFELAWVDSLSREPLDEIAWISAGTDSGWLESMGPQSGSLTGILRTNVNCMVVFGIAALSHTDAINYPDASLSLQFTAVLHYAGNVRMTWNGEQTYYFDGPLVPGVNEFTVFGEVFRNGLADPAGLYQGVLPVQVTQW